MIAAATPVQRPAGARLFAIDTHGRFSAAPRPAFARYLRAGDLVVANDAATMPASLAGTHLPTGSSIEVRLAGRSSLDGVREFSAIVFGAGDYHVPTEARPLPPPLARGDGLQLGPLHAKVEELLGHPRLALIRFDGASEAIWAGIAHHGHPIQYAYMTTPLALWDVWTPIAGPPVAFEPPSAGFVLDWRTVGEIRMRGAGFVTLTHAAGISSTGDPALDLRLPFDEPYRIPRATAEAIGRARAAGGRIIAVGTTVVRALEDAADESGAVRAGEGMATRRIGAETRLRVVDAILSGTHEPGTSHYELLLAFTGTETLASAAREMEAGGYRTHEFGDSVFVERGNARTGRSAPRSL